MKLLIVTQTIDRESPTLGFFHEWVAGLAESFESIEVICLYEGENQLPENVRVHSLGKERATGKFSRIQYITRFLHLAWKLRRQYDAVFVHMNQEYILLTGPLWKMLGKSIYMWRNHYAGSFLTDLAAAFCTKVFCTSRYSYTAHYQRAVLMPVGVNIDRFTPGSANDREPNSILFLSRIAPSKNPLLLLDALHEISKRQVSFTATFVGSPLPQHEEYYRNLIARAEHYGLSDCVSFLPGVPNAETLNFYRRHSIFVNCSPSGMYDKVLFESAATGAIVLALSGDYQGLAGEQYAFTTAPELADRIENFLKRAPGELIVARQSFRALAEQQSLSRLMRELATEIES
jgi:glycosyltransferase involved in cell wall biosynthesis